MIARANFDMNEELLKQIWSDSIRHVSRGRKWIVPLAVLLFFSGTLIIYFKLHERGFQRIGYFLVVIGLYYLIWYFWTKRKWFAERRKAYGKHTTVEIIFEPNRVHMSGPLSNGHADWALFVRVVPTPRGMFLYPQPRMFIYIPDTALEPLEAKMEIVKKIQENM